MKKFYFDSHVHLDLYKDIDNIIEQINEFKSYTIAVTNLPILYKKALNNIQITKYIRVALGLHPELIHKFPEQISVFFENVKEARYIGEVGLDFSRDYLPYKELQKEFFKRCVNECNYLGGKILSIHSRNATKEVIDIIGPNFNGKIILHWFNGNFSSLSEAIDYGYFFSVNNEMTKSVNGRKIIERLPIDRILLESDGPFTQTFKKKYDINLMENLVNNISEIKKCKINDTYHFLKENFINILKT